MVATTPRRSYPTAHTASTRPGAESDTRNASLYLAGVILYGQRTSTRHLLPAQSPDNREIADSDAQIERDRFGKAQQEKSQESVHQGKGYQEVADRC